MQVIQKHRDVKSRALEDPEWRGFGVRLVSPLSTQLRISPSDTINQSTPRQPLAQVAQEAHSTALRLHTVRDT
jgi:hypothetical protein